jgi:hypothetical protein
MKKEMWVGDAPGGNYTTKVREVSERMVAAGHLLFDVDVRHDEGCAVFRENPCNCDPDVVVISIDGKPVCP